MWRLADGTPVGEPLAAHDEGVTAAAAGAPPDGTPVIISGSDDGTVRVWRLADGTPVGEPLTGHSDQVLAVAVGALPDGSPVIISGGWDGTVRVWRLGEGLPRRVISYASPQCRRSGAPWRERSGHLRRKT